MLKRNSPQEDENRTEVGGGGARKIFFHKRNGNESTNGELWLKKRIQSAEPSCQELSSICIVFSRVPSYKELLFTLDQNVNFTLKSITLKTKKEGKTDILAGVEVSWKIEFQLGSLEGFIENFRNKKVEQEFRTLNGNETKRQRRQEGTQKKDEWQRF